MRFNRHERKMSIQKKTARRETQICVGKTFWRMRKYAKNFTNLPTVFGSHVTETILLHGIVSVTFLLQSLLASNPHRAGAKVTQLDAPITLLRSRNPATSTYGLRS